MKEKNKFWRVPLVLTLILVIFLLLTVALPFLLYCVTGGGELSSVFGIVLFAILLRGIVPLAIAVFVVWLLFIVCFFILKHKNK